MNKSLLAAVSLVFTIASGLIASWPKHARAEKNETSVRFVLPLSFSTGFGTLQDSAVGLKVRTMSAASFEILPALSVGHWMFGPHLDYRIQGQLDSLSSANGTNLKGRALLFGIGLRNELSNRAYVQESFDFFGEYDLTRNTSNFQDDKYKDPFAVRIKTGYAFIRETPNLTFDFDIQYLSFQKIEIAKVDYNSTARQFIAAVGVTYSFGSKGKISSSCEPAPVAETTLFKLDLQSGAYHFGSAYLGAEYKAKIIQAANQLKSDPSINLNIEGHIDAAESRFSHLARRRAEAVKTKFVEAGIAPSRLKVTDAGARQPASTDTTEEARSQNRRVEVLIENGESK